MIVGSVARRYAKALLSIGIEQKSYDALGKELDGVARVFDESPDLKAALASPVFPPEKRRAIVEELSRRLALSKTLHTFLMLLLDKNRIGSLPDIARAHRGLVDEQAGRVRATVTTAQPIDPAMEQRLKTALEKRSGKTVILEKRQDASIIGGMITQLGDTLYDGSVRSHLDSLRADLLTE